MPAACELFSSGEKRMPKNPWGAQQQSLKHRLQPEQPVAGPDGSRSGNQEAVRPFRHRREWHPRVGKAGTGLSRHRWEARHKPADIGTVREVVNRWAPGVENDTESYINDMAVVVGLAPNQPIDLRNFRTLIGISTGIIQHQYGSGPYSTTVISEGVQRALVSL